MKLKFVSKGQREVLYCDEQGFPHRPHRLLPHLRHRSLREPSRLRTDILPHRRRGLSHHRCDDCSVRSAWKVFFPRDFVFVVVFVLAETVVDSVSAVWELWCEELLSWSFSSESVNKSLSNPVKLLDINSLKRTILFRFFFFCFFFECVFLFCLLLWFFFPVSSSSSS